MFASSVQFFALTNLDVRFHFNSATFFLSFSAISKALPSTWTVASGVRSWWLFYLLSGISSSAKHSMSESFKRFSVSLSVSLSILSSVGYISLLSVSRPICIYFFLLFLSINIFLKLCLLHIHSSNCKKSFSLLSLFTTGVMCYSKATKREITYIEHWKRNMYKRHTLHCQNNKKHSSNWKLKKKYV